MSKADHEKMDRMAEVLHLDDQQTQTMHSFLDQQLEAMKHEDPDELIPCCCCGEMYPSSEIDVWGNCPTYSRSGNTTPPKLQALLDLDK
jgi:hypothetical protein